MAKISIPIAVKGTNRFDLSFTHATTSDFGQLQVSQFMPVVPNDSINVSVFSEARFAPLVVPTFMDCKLIHRAFYVPMSAIWKPFENFYRDAQDSSAYKAMPYITNDYLVQFFDSTYGLSREVDADMAYDFAIADNDTTYYYLMTEKGRIFYKLLLSLGYSINFSLSDQTHLSLLPLFAFARVAYDYIYPSQYLDGLGLNAYFNISSSDDFDNYFDDQTKIDAFLNKVCTLLTLPYKQDYFTASWQNLNQPGLSYQSISLNTDALTASRNETVQSTANSIYQIAGTASSKSAISQFGLNLLSRLYDFVTRNNIVGSRYADQIFAKFGIGSRKSDPDMSQFLGQHIQPINVVDVTAMSAAEGQDLGDLAGKAYLQGSGNLFHFESVDEFGYILTLSFVMPEIGYYQGRRRWVTQTESRFDWLNPEFDMQMRACRNDELFADFKSSSDYAAANNYGGVPANRFSFVPNFSDLKTGFDVMSGDFRLPSLSKNLAAYFMLRDIPTPSSTHPLALNASFLFMQQHEFDKIFAQPYALRYPITLRQGLIITDNYTVDLSHFEFVCYDGRPVLFRFNFGTSEDPNNKYWALYRDTDDNLRVLLVDLSLYWSALGINPNNLDNDAYVVSTAWTIGTIIKWKFLNTNFELYTDNDGTFVPFDEDVVATDASDYYMFGLPSNVLMHYQDFLMLFVDYIDHIYIKHRFTVKAERGMVPISEEFMIQDGGNKVSVDMNGNRIV